MSGEVVTANPSKDRSQVTVALAIIGSVTMLGLGLLVVVDREHDDMLNGAALTALGTILGGLIQSLNSPTGIGNVIASAMAKPASSPPP